MITPYQVVFLLLSFSLKKALNQPLPFMEVMGVRHLLSKKITESQVKSLVFRPIWQLQLFEYILEQMGLCHK